MREMLVGCEARHLCIHFFVIKDKNTSGKWSLSCSLDFVKVEIACNFSEHECAG